MKKDYEMNTKELEEKYRRILCVHSKRKLTISILVGILIAGGAGFTGGYFAIKAFGNSGTVEKESYIVEFDTNGGSSISAIKVEKGNKLDITKYQPTKSSCLFDGWYLDSELTNLCPKQLEVKSNTKIYAKWKNKVSEKGLGYILNPDGHSYSVYMADEDEWSTEASYGVLVIPEKYQEKPITSIGYYDEEKEITYGFQGCLKLTNIDFTNCVATQIAPYAFKNCFRFANGLNLSSSITSIGTEAFANCYLCSGFGYNETKVVEIGDRAFINNYCISLIDDSVFKNLVRIGKEAFANCYNLDSIFLANATSLLQISDSCFENCVISGSCSIPTSVTKIGKNAFKNTFTKDAELTFKDTFSSWSKEDGTKVETDDIKSALYNGDLIYKNSFYAESDNLNFYILGIDDATNDVYVSVANPQGSTKDPIVIPKEINYQYQERTLKLIVTRIAEYGFSDSKIITEVTIPSSVTTIGANAFENSSVATVVIDDSSNGSELKAIGDNAFKNTAITGIDLPNGLLSIGDNAFCYTNLGSINIPNSVIEIKNSTVIDSTTKEKVIHAPFYGCSKLENIAIDHPSFDKPYYTQDGVLMSRIDNNNKTLLKFPQAKDCGTTGYAIPNDIHYIANGAFYDINKVSKITIPDDTVLSHINDYAFASSDTNNITEISINTNTTLKYIGYKAFAKTKITSFNMPSTVTFLGGKCFEGCTNYKGQDVGEGVFKFVIPQNTLYIDTNTITGCSKILSKDQIDFANKNTSWTIYKNDGSIVEKEFNPIDTDGSVKNYAFQMLKGEYGNRYWVNDNISE